MSFRVKLAFCLDEETTAEVSDGLHRIMEMHRRTRALMRVPEYLPIIDMLAKGIQISREDWIVAFKPEFDRDVETALSLEVTTEELEDVQKTLQLFAAEYVGQVLFSRQDKLLFDQYTQYGGIQ